MESIALLADIHGNTPALLAVEADIKQRGIETVYCLGDIVGGGPNNDGALEICKRLCDKMIMGNWEDFLINSTHPKAVKYVRNMSPKTFEFIKTLPASIKFSMSGRRIHLFHGRPLIPEVMWFENSEEEKLRFFRTLEDDREPDIVGYADLHRQLKYDFSEEKKTLFNTGSVGNPYSSGSQACYVILRGDMDKEEISPFSMEFIMLPYDVEAAVREAESAGDWFDAAPYIESIRAGEWRGIN